MAETGVVYLVGAGPGHPGLLTLRAVQCLQRADLVLYDRLVPVSLLDQAPATAQRVCIDELAPLHTQRWPHIHRALIDAARDGRRVVRLKGGDPFVFGRGAEEAEALREAGIRYEIVPGVTAALGATAYAGISVTHRRHASAVAFVTGHENPEKPGSTLDWAALARFPGTLVFYMAVASLDAIVRALLAHGKSPDTPAALIHRGSLPEQVTLRARLADVATAQRSEGKGAPSLLVVGNVAAEEAGVGWVESLPLYRKRVVVTRPRHQASEMLAQIEELGGEALLLPGVEIVELRDWSEVDAALGQLKQIHWLVFTSSNGVHAFMGRLRATGHDLRALGHLAFAVIGPATAEALRGYHLQADVQPKEFNSEGLTEALRERVRGSRVLLLRADRGLELLRDELGKVAEVKQVAVYSQRDATLESDMLRRVSAGEVDYLTLTSSNIARTVVGGLDEAARSHLMTGRTHLVSISPRTTSAIREVGYAGNVLEASEYTTAGVVAVMREHATEQFRSGS